jgi:hypothetical protein
MGLFSGGFGTGLATGLAESVDQSLKTAMDKRDKEISRARQFWETRQAQKMDLADEHDRRAEAALSKMIGEFNGDVAKGLAAYQAVGGDVDSVEAYLTDLTDTRKAVGQYDITEKLNLDGVDMSQFADITREQALGSIRMEVKPVDVQMEDTGLLSKVGLGMKNMGEAVSSQINQNIPPRERDAIASIAGATMDRTGMISNIKHKAEMQNQIGSLENQMGVLTYQISTGKDAMGVELTEADRAALEIQRADVLATMGAMQRELDPNKGPTAGTIASMYSKGLSELTNELGFEVSPEGIATITTREGRELVGAEALAHWRTERDAWKADFTKNSILDENGNYVSNDAEVYARGLGLSDFVETARGEEAEAAPEAEAPAAEAAEQEIALADMTPAQAGFDTAQAVVENPQGFADYIVAANPSVSMDALAGQMQEAGVPVQTIINILTPMREAMEQRAAQAEADQAALDAFLKPKTEEADTTPAGSGQSAYHQRIYGTVGE